MQALIIAGLPFISQALKVSSFLGCNWLGDPLAVSPKWRSLRIAPPTANVLDHPGKAAMNGQRADTFKIRDVVNRLKLVNTLQGIRRLRIKLDSLLGDRRDRLDPLLIIAFRHDNNNVVAPAELDHAMEG